MEPADMTCLLKVNTKTAGWQTAMIHVFQNIGGIFSFSLYIFDIPCIFLGVYDFTIDADEGTAKVCGKVDPSLLLSVLAKSGKHVEIVWIHFDNQPPYSQQYMQHGNGYGHGYYGNNGYLQYHGHGGMNHHDHQLAYYHQPQPQNVQAPSKPPPTYKGLPPVKGKQYNGNVECCSVM